MKSNLLRALLAASVGVNIILAAGLVRNCLSQGRRGPGPDPEVLRQVQQIQRKLAFSDTQQDALDGILKRASKNFKPMQLAHLDYMMGYLADGDTTTTRQHLATASESHLFVQDVIFHDLRGFADTFTPEQRAVLRTELPKLRRFFATE